MSEKKCFHEAKNLCVWGKGRRGGQGKVGGTKLKKDNNFFYFKDLGFSEFRVDASKQNAEPSSYFMNLVFDSYSFSGFKKIPL